MSKKQTTRTSGSIERILPTQRTQSKQNKQDKRKKLNKELDLELDHESDLIMKTFLMVMMM